MSCRAMTMRWWVTDMAMSEARHLQAEEKKVRSGISSPAMASVSSGGTKPRAAVPGHLLIK
jgi:hypothetical protein